MLRRLSGLPFGGSTPTCEKWDFVTDNVVNVTDRVYVRSPSVSQPVREKLPIDSGVGRGERTCAFLLVVRPFGRGARCQWRPHWIALARVIQYSHGAARSETCGERAMLPTVGHNSAPLRWMLLARDSHIKTPRRAYVTWGADACQPQKHSHPPSQPHSLACVLISWGAPS